MRSIAGDAGRQGEHQDSQANMKADNVGLDASGKYALGSRLGADKVQIYSRRTGESSHEGPLES